MSISVLSYKDILMVLSLRPVTFFKLERFILAHSRRGYSPLCQRSHGDGRDLALVAGVCDTACS